MTRSLVQIPRALMPLERARLALAEARDVATVIEIHDVARVAKQYAIVKRAGRGAVNDATRLQLDALRRLGEFLAAQPPSRGRPKKNVDGDDIFRTLEKHGITRDESSRAQRLFRVPRGDYDKYVRSVCERGELLTLKGAIAAPSSFAADYDGDEHYSPPWLADAARKVMGGIDLDPASCRLAQTLVGAQRFYTAKDNGLELEWLERVYLNSPFSRGLELAFTRKLLAELEARRVRQCIRVMNSTTDTRSFHALASRGLVCCFEGRINFYREHKGELVETDGNRTPQVAIYIGRSSAAFRREFSRYGLVGELRR